MKNRWLIYLSVFAGVTLFATTVYMILQIPSLQANIRVRAQFVNIYFVHAMIIASLLVWVFHLLIMSQFITIYKWGGSIVTRRLSILFIITTFFCSWSYFLAVYNIFTRQYIVQAVNVLFIAISLYITICETFRSKENITDKIKQDRENLQLSIQVLQGLTIVNQSNVEDHRKEIEAVTTRLRNLHMMSTMEDYDDMHQGKPM